MDAPVLVVVPPTPRATFNTRRKEPSPLSNPSKPSDEKTRKSSSSLTSYDSQAGSNNPQGRTSSEKTAVNIYDLYSGSMDRDSYASSSNGPTTNGGASTESDTMRGSTRRSESRTPPATRVVYSENRHSIASSARESLRDSVYATPLQTPMDMATVPSQDAPVSSSNAHVNGRSSEASENGYLLASPGQVVEHTGRNSPTIVIDPPPRQSSKLSLDSANHSLFDRSKDHPSASSSPRASMSSAARPSLSPTRLSTDPATSATSSSAPSVPQHPLPSPLLPNAPSPGVDEDPDSYYVRATYAALDVTGVRGDGYEDGEELTRARLGNARGTLPSPIPTTAKRMEMGGKELSEKEKELLGQLDR
ncbi:11346_t:CDS:1, partial [Acaulospora colombiana]